MILHEPVTLVTDCLLSALAAWLSLRLRGFLASSNLSARWWSLALAGTAVSAFVGGTYHGFGPNLPAPASDAWWGLTLVSIALMSAAMDLSLMYECAGGGRMRAWRGVIALKLATFLLVLVPYPKFGTAILDYGITMLAWAACAVTLRRRWLAPMLGAIGLSLCAALVQQLRWSPGTILNHNDVYHVIQAFALIGFYRAGCRLGLGVQGPN
jgi:hypothetical protein